MEQLTKQFTVQAQNKECKKEVKMGIRGENSDV